jgi:carbonic anhydrase/acetyltransferase-like protein (isoleucine patch superfamily)
MNPEIHNSTFVHKTAVIIGNVKIGKNCGVYPFAVIRGDENTIEIGDGTNVQDNCVIHCDIDHPVKIGENVSLGHCSVIHGAIIEDECLIGINSTVLNGAKIGKGSIVGANALVTEGMIIPENSLVIGIPGKIIKQDKNFREKAQLNAEIYRKISKSHINKKHEEYNVKDQ